MSQRGFTLLEMAFVIAIIGLFVGGGLLTLGPVIDKSNTTQTNNNMDQVENALELFVIRYSRLPCPADGSQPPSSATYGLESTPVGGNGSCNITAALNNANLAVVPWRTLGLDESYSLDAWGNRFSYYVAQPGDLGVPAGSAALTSTQSPLTLSRSANSGTNNGYPTSNYLTVADASSGLAVTPPTTSNDQAAYVLISHGKSGWYGWSKSGVATVGGVQHAATFAGGPKGCNNNPATCSVLAQAFVTGRPSGAYPPRSNAYFDDIVRWRSPAFIIQMCGIGSCGN